MTQQPAERASEPVTFTPEQIALWFSDADDGDDEFQRGHDREQDAINDARYDEQVRWGGVW